VSGILALLAVLVQLALGTLFAALICDVRAEVTRGFLFLAAGIALISGLLAVALAGLAHLDGAERWLLLVLCGSLLAYCLLLVRKRSTARLFFGSLGTLAGLVALVVGALERTNGMLGTWPTIIATVASALALGTANGGLLLGHWYLVTPRLTSRPLRLLCDLLLVSLVPLTGLAIWYVGRGESAANFAGLSGPPLWLGIGMITLFPFAVTAAARICCVDGPGRGRSLQAATGLLYLVAAAILAGGLAGNAVLLGA
jgi:hypothetical protein